MIVRQRNMFERYSGPIICGHYQVMENLLIPGSYHVLDLEKFGEDWRNDEQAEVTSLNGGELWFKSVEEAEQHAAMRLAYEMTNAKDAEIELSLDEIIAAAWGKGWFMSILYEMQVGRLWHCRFDRGDAHDGRERQREGSYAPTAIEAMWAAYEEIETPGINAKRREKNIGREWSKALKQRGLERLPLRDNGEPHKKAPKYVAPDLYALEAFLASEYKLAMELEEAVASLVKALGGEVEDQEDFI